MPIHLKSALCRTAATITPLIILCGGPATAQTFIAFGDSLSDTGNAFRLTGGSPMARYGLIDLRPTMESLPISFSAHQRRRVSRAGTSLSLVPTAAPVILMLQQARLRGCWRRFGSTPGYPRLDQYL
jgi:hypothetical protein